MPDVRNCKRCGRIFNYIGGVQLCPHCREEDEEDFKRIKRYLFENPKATVSEVASELNISIEKIKKFLREERLEIVGDPKFVGLECEKCGKPINTGRFCDECSRDLASGFNSVAKRLEEQVKGREGVGLRYLSKILEEENENKKDVRSKKRL